MRLSHPIAIKTVGLVFTPLFQGWMSTLNVRFKFLDPQNNPFHAARGSLFMVWHEGLLLPTYTHASRGIVALVSQHRDGELIAQILRMLRGKTIRGSTTRGGAPALRAMMRQSGAGHLGITPDGPRGPRRVVQQGSVYLASRMGIQTLPIGVGFSRCWRMPSWDRFAIPRAGSNAVMVIGKGISVPDGLDREQLEPYRQQVQLAMEQAQSLAEELAAGSPSQKGLVTIEQVYPET